jgi:tetratricopeptide (TPR) repeat protein
MTATVFFGTCQAQSLCKIYNAFIADDFEPPARYISSNLPLGPADQETILRAPVIINQVFSFTQKATLPRGDLGSKRIIDFPYLAGWFLWPYASEAHINRRYFPKAKVRPYDDEIGDAFLNRQIRRGVPVEEAVNRYMALDIISVAHVPSRTEMIFDQQREREKTTDIKAFDFIERNISRPDLFLTRGHPGLTLILHLCSQVFELMGVKRPLIDHLHTTLIRVPDHTNQAAVHPSIGAYFKINTGEADRTYFQFNGKYTFEECCRRYMNYEWNQDIVEGIYFEDTRQDDHALVSLASGLSKEPKSASGHHALGRVLERKGRLEDAEQSFKAAHALEPDSPTLAIGYSNLLVRCGRMDAAESTLLRAMRHRPNWPDLNVTLSHLHTKCNRIQSAITAVENAIRFSTKTGGLLPHYARLLVRNRDFDAALQVLTRAIAISPGDASLRLWLADILLQLRRPDDALQACHDANQIAPSDTRLMALAAETVNRCGRAEEATAIYRLILAIDPMHRGAHVGLAHLLARFGDSEGSVTHCTAALRLAADDAPLLVHLGNQLAKLDRFEDAEAAYFDALILNAGTARVHFLLSRILAKQGKLDYAICAARNAVSLEPKTVEFEGNLQALIQAHKRRRNKHCFSGESVQIGAELQQSSSP